MKFLFDSPHESILNPFTVMDRFHKQLLWWPKFLAMLFQIDLIRNYGPGTRDGASGFDRAAGVTA